MAHAHDRVGILQENLVDAECDERMVERCLSLAEQQQTEQLQQTLSRHRRTLLEDLHRDQKHIYCLDYLLHQLESLEWVADAPVSRPRPPTLNKPMNWVDLSERRHGR